MIAQEILRTITSFTWPGRRFDVLPVNSLFVAGRFRYYLTQFRSKHMWLFLYCACLLCASPKDSSAVNLGIAIEVSVELWRGKTWQPVDARTVFHKNDEIRFRFRTPIGGHLYILNRSSEGKESWLFPAPDRGQSSRIEAGPEYLVPGRKSFFVVGGKPGFDVTYWILSPLPIDAREVTGSAFASQPSTLEPRCGSEGLKARGVCLDERAGPHLLEQSQPLLQLPRDTPLISRDLTFRTQNRSTRISGPSPESGVIIYEFRVAHD